ncbi:MAG: hypothetical protein Q8O26_10840 [Phreatobacter sp.]|uniref:hypothetical protein n=1 Tax=Phreatobacter sp. TaxID=1966341 RepID=UPI0027371162|nr:hypothetical protein [Phreatobacter sp.]MDP2802370.1 hypothetical protein [Phreatobacter sp.]
MGDSVSRAKNQLSQPSPGGTTGSRPIGATAGCMATPGARLKGKPSKSIVLIEWRPAREAAAKFLVAIARRTAYLMATFRPFFFGPAPVNRRTADKNSSKT